MLFLTFLLVDVLSNNGTTVPESVNETNTEVVTKNDNSTVPIRQKITEEPKKEEVKPNTPSPQDAKLKKLLDEAPWLVPMDEMVQMIF